MEKTNNLDPEIIEAAKTDSEAFAKLYDFYLPKVYAFVQAKVSSKQVAEDLVSDIFMKVVENLPKYNDRGYGFGCWLFTVARNVVYDYYSKNSKQNEVSLDESIAIKDDKTHEQPLEKAKQAELKEKVGEVMNKLSERDLSILQLKFYSGLNNREIASVLDLSEGNVAIILFRVLRKMKPDLLNLI